MVIPIFQKDREERKGKGGGTTLCKQVMEKDTTMSFQLSVQEY